MFHLINYCFLQGQKVFITPNTKPGKEVLASLVKAVHGMVRMFPCLSLELSIRTMTKYPVQFHNSLIVMVHSFGYDKISWVV